MMSTHNPNRLHTQLANMVALETTIEQALDKLIPEVSDHTEVSAMFREFHAMTKSQLQVLEARLQTVADNMPIPDGTATVFFDGERIDGSKHPVSTALQTIYAMFNQAVIGYSTLQPISARFRDSWVVADEGTTAHLAWYHTQNYVRAIQQIARELHNVVLWELDREGLECQCICPSCGLGVCLCAVSSRTILSDAWIEAGPIVDDEGVYVHPPRKESAAANAGLHSGDVILSVDGQEIQSYSDLQTAVRNHKSGEEIQLKVHRGSDELEDITVVHP